MDSPGFGRQSGQAGLHRLRDPKGDGSFTTIDTLRTWDGHEGGHSDHGIHEARVSPDGKQLLHHQRQRRGAAARRVAELAAAQLRGRPHHSAARPADQPPRAREGAGRHHRPDHLRGQGLSPLRRRHAQRAALRLERRRRDLLVRQRHGAGVRRALVSAGARVLDAERRRPRLSRQQRQVSRPGTRIRCRRSWRSGSAARSA